MPRSSAICVDANLIIRRLTDPDNETIQHLWDSWDNDRRPIVAPMLIRYEVTNALHRLRQAGEMSDSAIQTGLGLALSLPIEVHTEVELHRQALDFAARFNLPAAYDAHYLALAERRGAEFWTADKRLFRAVQRDLAWVRLAE